MENRRSIREYLDNPKLLTEISIGELQLWADEVPYAAIIHQLMAMKVVQEEETPAGREILQRATLHSPNPDRLSRQLHKLAGDASPSEMSHTLPDDARQITTSDYEDHNAVSQEAPDDTILSSDQRTASDVVVPVAEEDIEVPVVAVAMEEEEVVSEEGETELSEFSQWLMSLNKVEQSDEDEEKSSIPTDYKDIASETLAELLAKQGHKTRAIAMYEQLTLIYPKKSSFFASQIQKIQGL